MESTSDTIDLSAFCVRCLDDDLAVGMLCRRDTFQVIDHGTDRDADLARFEGLCIRCCGHNHG